MTTSLTEMRQRRVTRASVARSLPWLALTIGIVGVFVVPFITLVVMAFRTRIPGLGGEWTTDGIVAAYGNGRMVKPLFDSLLFATASAVCGTLIGIYFVFVSTRTRLIVRRMVTPMMVVILATPTLFFALSWAMLGADRVGLINTVYSSLTGSDDSIFTINSWLGLIFVMSIKLSAFCYFLMLGPSLRMNRALEEAAEVSGSGPAGAFFRIYLPLLFPSILGSLLIGFIVGLQAFDIPQIIGVQAGVRVLSTEIFEFVNLAPANYAAAASVSIGLVAMLGFLVWAQMALLKGRDYTTIGGKASASGSWEFPRAGWLINSSVVLFAVVAFVLPTIQLVLSSLNTVFGRYDDFSLRNYERLFDDPMTFNAIRNTVQYVVIGGFVTVLIGAVITTALRSRPTRAKRLLEIPTWIPWATPGLVGTLSILGTLLAFPALHPIYGTPTAMLLALVIASLPMAIRFTENAVLQIDRQLIDASRISGASTVRSFATVVVPLIAPSFAAGWFVTGLAIAGNLEVPLLLGTVKQTTIAGLAYKFQVDSMAPLAAALFCVLLVTVLALFVVGVFGRVVVAWATAQIRTARVARFERSSVDGPGLDSEPSPDVGEGAASHERLVPELGLADTAPARH